MRYISVARLEEGMTLAKPLYGDDFIVALDSGIVLGGQDIRRVS